MSTMSKKRTVERSRKTDTLPILRANAAGADIGAGEIFVAVPADRDPEPVRCLATFTEDLHRLADWLQSGQIDTVAMESTGVYWIALFQILEARGLEVCLVNARYFQNVPGRRTDVGDCQWLQYLHGVGLWRGSFRPAQEVCLLRSLLRHRVSLIPRAATHVLPMPKALDQRNLPIHHAIGDITGLTGRAITDAILAGERDPKLLAKRRDGRIEACEDTSSNPWSGITGPSTCAHFASRWLPIATINDGSPTATARLSGSWLGSMPKSTRRPSPYRSRRSGAESSSTLFNNEPSFDRRGHLYRIFGVDRTAVPGRNVRTAHTLRAEVGPDLSKFRSASAFASGLGLCPDNDISGGQILSVRTRRANNHAALAFRLAANARHGSKSWRGDCYRRRRAKLGAPKAIAAAAHKLARIVYHLPTTRQP
jgi:transposase